MRRRVPLLLLAALFVVVLALAALALYEVGLLWSVWFRAAMTQ